MASEIAKAAIARITKNQAISAKILIAMMDGTPVDQAIDRVLGAGTWKKLTSELYDELRKKDRASRPGAPDTFAVEDRFYFGKGRKERFASISIPRQSVTSGASGTWKKREVTVRGKKAWLVELHRGGVLVGYLNQHPDTRQFHAFDGNTDQQIGVGGESEMKRLVESL